MAEGLLRIIPNDELVRREQSAIQDAEAANARPPLDGIAGHVMQCWQAARDAKARISSRMQGALRAKQGQYDPTKLAAIRAFGGSEEYARITANKCRTAVSWLRDVYLGQNDKPWTLKPTPKPDMPPESVEMARRQVSMEMAQAFAVTGQPPDSELIALRLTELEEAEAMRVRDEARRAAERMEERMFDQMVEGGWHEAFGDFLDDLCTYPAAHFKGPIPRMRSKVIWQEEGGVWAPVTEDTVAPEFERVDPFRIYPSPNSTSPQEGYIIEHLSYSRDDLYSLIGVEGFNEMSIRAVLEEYGRGGLVDWLGFSNERGDRDTTDTTNTQIDALEFHGMLRGRDLLEWGLDDTTIDDPDKDYEACVWLVGRWVIKAQLNYNPLGRRPYYKSSYEEVPGQYWGMGLVDILEDIQGVANATVRALVNNMSMASGPQVEVNVDRLPPGTDITTLTPWRIWQVLDSQYGSSAPAVQFFQPSPMVNELLTVLEKFYQFADDFSLIPRYMAGNDRVGGAGRTASGLSMLLNAANKGLKGVVSTIDIKVLEPLLHHQYTYNMLFLPDENIKGDVEPLARGAVSLMQLESLQLRRNEFLAATANPIDSQIVGMQGRAEILREVAKGLEMDVNKVVPPVPTAIPQEGGAGTPPAPNREMLENGAATTDNFSPNAMRQVA